MITLPNLHTLVFHLGVLKPRYLQHTISAIHVPVLRHFEFVFPASTKSSEHVAEQLFVGVPPLAVSSVSSSSYASSPWSSSAPEAKVKR